MHIPLTRRQQQIFSLRLKYLGGYSVFFAVQAKNMLADGFTIEELLDYSVDEHMQDWIRNLNLSTIGDVQSEYEK